MADDYYNILGIDKKASATQIKKAYRKLALKYHPDKTKGDKALEDKFKKISEAYAVLSDPEKRNQYDTYGSADFQQRFSQEDIFRNFDLGDILKEFGFGGGRGGGFSSAFGRGGQRGGMGGGNPFLTSLEAFDSPIYSMKAGPGWADTGFYGNYFSGHGPVNPPMHHNIYGANFHTLPAELGGEMAGDRGRFAGTPNA